jgi:glycosyltransferase involved in cell wall biosynthesis
MTIIHANKYYFLKGGAERYMLELSNWLERQGHKVVPFAMAHPDNLSTPYAKYFVSQIKTNESEISPLSKGGLRGVAERLHTFGRMMYSLEARRNLATLITHTRPDLCHIHSIYTQISPSILHTLKDQHVPVVMTVHDHHLISPQYNVWAQGCGEDYRDVGLLAGTLARYHKGSLSGSFAQTLAFKFHRALKIYERGVEMFICPSRYMKRQLIRGGFSESKIVVIPYGIDVARFEPRYDHDGYFLFVGRLSEEKGIETIVRVARLLPDLRFKIVGRGPRMEYLHRLADGLTNVDFMGFHDGDELRDLYRGARAVLLPSRVHENFPLTILEAMAFGKPVIASNVGGVPETIEDRVSGLLVSPADLHGWAEAVMRVAYDDEMQSRMSHEARLAVERGFGLEEHYRRVMEVYQNITQK